VNKDLKQNQVLVRYGEIALKSAGIRGHFEVQLTRHLRAMLTLKDAPFDKIHRERGRFFIQTSEPLAIAEVAARVFGVVSTSPVWTVPSKPEQILQLIGQLTPQLVRHGDSFAVRARRLKDMPFTSQELAAKVGAKIMETAKTANQPVSVDLDKPDVEVHIEIRQKSTYIFTQIIPGPGGLPYGTQGMVIGLHSGGLDSPVAQWLMMKRGASVLPLYLDSDKTDEKQFRNRALESAKILADWIPSTQVQIIIVPFYKILKSLQKVRNRKLTCILCKRMMYRIGAMVASQEGAHALVTGETLGQVASQTLTNLAILDTVVSVPIFRPLIGMDKTETMDLARRIGTYDVSSKDVGECFAVPKKPTIAAELNKVHETEYRLPISKMVSDAISQLERVPLEK
jgi:thiamine biosynthesis protein ThiI